MNTIKIACPECKHSMEYWTRNNFINCTKCKASIPVEPCVEKTEEQTQEELTEEENEQPHNPTYIYVVVGGVAFDNDTSQEVR